MKWIFGHKQFIGGMLGLLIMAPNASARSHTDHPYRYSVVDVPVSLAVGTVQTPEFSVASLGYWILIQVEKPLPFEQMQCMMGVTAGPLDLKYCSSNDPLLRADWTVWDGEHMVEQGSSTTTADARYTSQYIFKFLGKFRGESGRKYILKVEFIKDGTPLNVANPHLIVTKLGEE